MEVNNNINIHSLADAMERLAPAKGELPSRYVKLRFEKGSGVVGLSFSSKDAMDLTKTTNKVDSVIRGQLGSTSILELGKMEKGLEALKTLAQQRIMDSFWNQFVVVLCEAFGIQSGIQLTMNKINSLIDVIHVRKGDNDLLNEIRGKAAQINKVEGNIKTTIEYMTKLQNMDTKVRANISLDDTDFKHLEEMQKHYKIHYRPNYLQGFLDVGQIVRDGLAGCTAILDSEFNELRRLQEDLYHLRQEESALLQQAPRPAQKASNSGDS